MAYGHINLVLTGFGEPLDQLTMIIFTFGGMFSKSFDYFPPYICFWIFEFKFLYPFLVGMFSNIFGEEKKKIV